MMEMVAVWSCLFFRIVGSFFHQLFNLSKGYPPIVPMGRVRVLIEFGATHQLSLWDKGTHYMIPMLPTNCPYGTRHALHDSEATHQMSLWDMGRTICIFSTHQMPLWDIGQMLCIDC